MIRRMTTDDYEELADMWMKTPNMGLRSLDDSGEGIGRFLKRNPETGFVAREDHRLVTPLCADMTGVKGFSGILQQIHNRPGNRPLFET